MRADHHEGEERQGVAGGQAGSCLGLLLQERAEEGELGHLLLPKSLPLHLGLEVEEGREVWVPGEHCG